MLRWHVAIVWLGLSASQSTCDLQEERLFKATLNELVDTKTENLLRGKPCI